MTKDPDCIFCKIVAGEIPSYKIAENDTCIAILDAFPLTKGHSLVITKRHCRDYLDMTPEELTGASALLRDVADAAVKAVEAPAVNLISNVGKPAGQVVMHAHMHAIPRHEDDSVTFTFENKPELSDEEKIALLEDIKKNM